MTTAADDRAVEKAFEASLAGRPVPGEAAGLAAFTRAVRGTATEPGRPNAALADLLSTGLLTDQSSPSARTAPAAGSLPSRRTRSRTRRRFTMIVPTLFAKFLSAGAVAQAATGAGVVCVVVTGAGAAGALPGSAQTAFEDATGISQSVEGDGSAQVTTDPTTPTTATPPADTTGASPTDVSSPPATQSPVVPTPTEASADGAEAELTEQEWQAGPADGQPFGEWVSIGRHNGWATGSMSSAAHERNDARKAARASDDSDEQESDDSGSDSPDDLSDDSDSDGSDDSSEDSDDDGDRSGKSGSGSGTSGSGKGSDNSGKGNSDRD